MTFASKEAGGIAFGTASFWWLTGAYLLHTIGELCTSPTALSFITKLAPMKYASIMMGVYFAATGFGNKLAGSIGEASQSEPIKIELTAAPSDLAAFGRVDTLVANDKSFIIKADLFMQDGKVVAHDYTGKKDLGSVFSLSDPEKNAEILAVLSENNATQDAPYHAQLRFEKDFEAKKVEANKGDGKNYAGNFIIEEVQKPKRIQHFHVYFWFNSSLWHINSFSTKTIKTSDARC